MRGVAASSLLWVCLVCLSWACLEGAWSWPDASVSRRSLLPLQPPSVFRPWPLDRVSQATSAAQSRRDRERERERADVLANRIGVPDEVDDPDTRVRFDAPSNARRYDAASRFPPRTPPAYAQAAAAAVPVRPAPTASNANAVPTGQGPSKCVWAIVTCCRPPSEEVRHACMETLGCGGPFWDNNPCGRRLTATAAQTALHFYSIH